ncbi:MAG: DsbA family protein [Motiliproteus sp.]|nr:DsbA family protein [Motiliproteus sp.]MCW9052032.1 DsbA family protein [Motiliproteus sp.]
MKKLLATTLCLAGALWLSPAIAEPSFSYDGQSYQEDSLPPALQQKFYELEQKANEQRRQAIDQYIVNRYLRERAKAESISVRQLQQQLLSVTHASDAELKAFYDSNQSRIKQPFAQVKERIAEFINNQRRSMKEAQLLTTIMTDKGYRVQLDSVEAPRFEVATEGYPTKGSADAKVTLIEFADYQCPHCKKASKIVKDLLKRYEGDLKVVYRDFPINPSGISRKVSEAAVCAQEQGKFWPFHDLAFERQSYLKAIKPDLLAKQVGLDMDQFNACYAGDDNTAKVAASSNEAEELGLTGTPSFFVNGKLLHVHGELEPALIKAVEDALKEQG